MPLQSNWIRTLFGGINLASLNPFWDSVLPEFGIGPEILTPTTAQTWAVGAAETLTLSATTFTDTLGASLHYNATQGNGAALPGWLAFDAASLTFSGTAPAAGSLTIRLIATDSYGLTNAEAFTLSATAPVVTLVSQATKAASSPPTVTNQTAAQTWLAGQAVSLVLPSNTFTDPQGSALTYSASLSTGGALPSWLKFNAATDSFTATAAPNTATTLSLKVTAKDALGLSVSETFSVKVVATPTVTAQTANQYYAPGGKISLTLPSTTFTDPQGAKLTYSASLSGGGSLPSWLTFNASTDSFTGTAPSTGGVTVQVTATDSYGLATSESFKISAASAPTVTAQTATQTWTQGTTVAFTLPSNTFTDPQGAKLTYSATLAGGGALPSWLKFNATTDSFSGTVPSGTSGFSLAETAKDSYGLSVTDTFAVSTPLPAAPPAGSGFVINVHYDSSVTSQTTAFQTSFMGAVNAAVSYLESHFTNNVTLNINVGFGEITGASGTSTAMVSGALGESTASYLRESYSTVVNALTSNASSADALAAVGTLGGTSSLSSMSFVVASGEAKALGLTSASGTAIDGGIGIASAYPFTYDPNNRAVAGDYDAIGTIEHEITEVMGRVGYLGANNVGYSPLDLFRYSSAGVHATTPGAGYFSVDGQTMLTAYNNPLNGGDATDWTSSLVGDSFGSGYSGVASLVSATDLREMNVIGWQRSALAA